MGKSFQERNIEQIKRLLKYSYPTHELLPNGKESYGYHTTVLDNQVLPGQRDPAERIKLVPYDFIDKKVLDIGCNQGAMLFNLADKISYGLGVDIDYKLINVCNKISRYKQYNIDFYTFDLDNENINIISDLSMKPRYAFDVVFFLAVSCWIKKWKETIDWSYEHADHMLFESNGDDIQQQEQWLYLMQTYSKVEKIADTSEDDWYQKKRKLYWCSK